MKKQTKSNRLNLIFTLIISLAFVPKQTEETTQTNGECSFDEPAGTVSTNSKPSAETFKRVIFEFYKGNANGRKVGITFQTFKLGKSLTSIV